MFVRACRLSCRVVAAASLALMGLTWAPSPADADPLPAAYSGSTDNNILGLDLGLFGLNLAGVGLAHSEDNVDSTATPPSTALASNIEAAVAGLGVGVSSVSESAPPDNGGPSTTGLGQVDVPGLLDTGLITGTADAHWAGDTACPPSGTSIASSSVNVAGVTIGNAATQVAQIGAASTSGSTSLVSNGGTGDARSVQSTSTGSVSGITLLNGGVTVSVAGSPTLTATASGSPGGASVTYTPPTITVDTPLTAPVTLAPGASVTINVPLVGSVTITAGVPTNVVRSADGTFASADLTLLDLDITLLGGLGTANIGVLPLHAEATAPTGGVQCGLLDAPVITTPADGSTTQDTTPTISGTGAPGATLTVTTSDGTVLGTTTVAADGTWSLVPADPLPLGSYTITATQTASGLTSAPSAPVTFDIVDTTAPDAPVIQSPADGSVINDPTPTISGTAEPGSSVEVVVDGVVLGTVTAGPGGAWSIPVTDPLADGAHTVTATATDASGNTSPTATNDFTVDTVAEAPTITAPADNAVVDDSTPTITGTAEPGSDVVVTVNGIDYTTTAGPGGGWTVTIPDADALPDGPYTISVVATDPAGNVSAPVTSDFTVDTTAPAAPVITGPAEGSTVGDSTPTITGTGEPGATVEVSIDGTVVGTTTVDASGNWSLDTTTPLADGPHTVSATQADAAGNTSPADTNSFTVDTTAAAAPVITSPTSGSVTNDDTVPITGTAEPNATVTVEVGGTAYVTTADGSGNWSITTDPLPDGSYTAVATQTDAAGNTSPTSSPVIFAVDTVIADPVITSPDDGSSTNDNTPAITGTAEPGSTVVVTVNGVDYTTTADTVTGDWDVTVPAGDALPDGTYTISVVATDPAGNVSNPVTSDFTVDMTAPDAPVISTPAEGSTIGDATPTVTGTAEPGATVEVSIDDTVVGTTTAAADGSWSLPLTTPLAEGEHTVSATQTDEAGNTSAPATVTFTVDTVAPDAPVITGPAPGSTVGTDTPNITGTAEPGSTVTVVVDGTTYETTAGPGGGWTVTVTTPLDDGLVTVTATATDAAGNTSAPTTSAFIVDTSAAAPVITSPPSGTVTNDATIALTGTGEPGATVTVFDETGDLVATAVVGSDGTWSATTTPLAEGPHALTATQVDTLGHESPASGTVLVTVDQTVAPPTVNPLPGQVTDTTPTITGTGEPGATVTVSIDGQPVGTAVVADDDAWAFTPVLALPDGEHTVTATQTDLAGNVSGPSKPVTLVIDTSSAPSGGGTVTGSGQGGSVAGVGGSAGGGGAGGSSVGGVLPDTGARAGLTGAALLGLLMLVGGFLLVRRRSGQASAAASRHTPTHRQG